MTRRGVVLALLLALAAIGVCSRAVARHGWSAREKPWAIEGFVARRLRRLATDAARARISNPVLATAANLAEGRDHFADHCSTCHADDGSGRTPIGEGLYPPPPDLTGPDTRNLSDGELLAIIRNGVRFTGMPGWGGTDDENWKLVLFIRHLPELTQEERERMRKARAGEASRHRHGHEH
jgi:mono/diheme cytochrome c family protein